MLPGAGPDIHRFSVKLTRPSNPPDNWRRSSPCTFFWIPSTIKNYIIGAKRFQKDAQTYDISTGDWSERERLSWRSRALGEGTCFSNKGKLVQTDARTGGIAERLESQNVCQMLTTLERRVYLKTSDAKTLIVRFRIRSNNTWELLGFIQPRD
jgi:hypothetical protein